MDENARAAFDEARENLRRLRDFKVERREHRDDGYSTDWAKGMPPKPPPVSIEDVRREITEALAKRPNGLTADDVEMLIAAKLAEHDVARDDAHGAVIARERKLWRAEIAKVLTAERTGGSELFYLDNDGNKQDRELHSAIIGPVDHPIDERIMGPIRQRHRQRWLDEQAATRAARRSQRRA